MANSEAMTSSTRSFAYSYRLVKKCFVKICETSKCHNFLIFQPIFIRFSLFCSENITLSSEIMLNLFRSSPLSKHPLNFIVFYVICDRAFHAVSFLAPVSHSLVFEKNCNYVFYCFTIDHNHKMYNN